MSHIKYYDTNDRIKEKQASRDKDAQDIASGAKCLEQLRKENGFFAFPNVKIDFAGCKKLA